VPVIVSEEMGAAELIRENRLGIVTSNLSDAILDIKNDYKRYAKLSKNAKSWVKNNLTWDNFGSNIVNVLKNITH
jgi:glycosyltransferase involved in cell wall biosynthesis